MSKRLVLWSGFALALLAGAIVVFKANTQSKQNQNDSFARSDEFVIARERMPDPVSPAALDIQVAEANVTTLEPISVNRRFTDDNITLFEKPTPKRPKLMGMGHAVDPAEVKRIKDAQDQDAEESDTEESEAAKAAAYLGPTAGLRFSFDTTNFDDNITTTGSVFIPPDSYAAAGPNHLVNVVNTTIRFHLKDGTMQFQDSLMNFFASLSPLTNTFDPKVLYDQYARRFVVVTLEQTDTFQGAPADTSRIFVAVSDDSDPNGTWFTTQINASTMIAGVPNWADFPGFSVDRDAVYITANMFSFFSFGGANNGNRMWAIAKDIGTGFYSGGPVTATVFNPVPAGGFGLTQQPSHAYGTQPFSGTFLAVFSGLSNGVDEFFQVIRVENPLVAPLLDLQFINFGNVDDLAGPLPNAPQLGSPVLVNTNDRRTQNAVWRNDSLYVTTQVNPAAGLPDAGQATAVWSEVDTSTLAALSLTSLSMIGGEDIAPGTSTTFPSIAVNRNGDVAVGFSACAATIHPSSYFATRLCTDPIGTIGPSTLLRAGVDFYVRTFGNTNRWGDYSSVAVDPITNMFWVYNEHALTRGTPTNPPLEDGRWGTAIGLTGPCVQTHSLPQNTWVFISLPCESRGATVANSFGDDLAGTFGVDWFGFGYNPWTQSRYALTLATRLSPGEGYFIRTTLAGQSVTVGDISNNKFGYKLAVNPGRLTLNLKGHPYPITACWADVLVIDGNNLLTLSQADPLIGAVRACDMNPPDPSCVMSRVAQTWNGSSFDAIDGITPGMQGTLEPFEGILIRAFKPGIGIRFSTVTNLGCGGPSAGGIESGMHNQTTAMQEGWYTRIVVESGNLRDSGAVFGQLPQASDGRDATDLSELAPLEAPFLSVGLSAGFASRDATGFRSDYRALDGLSGKDAWRFQVNGSEKGETVYLHLDGPAWLLGNGTLVDEATGKQVAANETYSYRQNGQARQFTFYPY